MKHSLVIMVTSLSQLLLQIPSIVQLFQKKSPMALNGLLAWIDECETQLLNYHMIEAAQIAGYKARILAPAFDDEHRSKLRKQQQAIGINLILNLQETLAAALEPSLVKVTQCREIAQQLLQVMAQSGSIKYETDDDIGLIVDQIWSICSTHEQLKPLAVQLKAILSDADVRIVIFEEFEPTDFQALPDLK